MSYVVLARKWRPQAFADMLGQEHVTRTLTNAINASRIAHAFLFSGPRGVGKTSAARILAKALCCEAEGKPTPAPCGVCRQCAEITEGRSTDVFEIDAASHTGVDNVREIIDNIRYLPSSARFKIYVIDEVHMLSTGAFNALLKTLEEPPAHVKFILATTDVHKVPVTILSRCQRYDFRRISLVEVAHHLSKILEREGIDHDPSAMTSIAREGEGSMRDAQSLLEQVLSFADGRRLDGPLVREALGVVDGALLARTFEALTSREPGTLIEIASEVHERGLDVRRFADALVETARDLLVAKLVPEPAGVLDRPSDEVAALVERARKLEVVQLERLFDRLCRLVEELGRSTHPRFALEIGLASIAAEPARVPVEDLLAKLGQLERELHGYAPQPGSPVRRSNDWSRSKPPPAPYVARARREPPQPSEVEDPAIAPAPAQAPRAAGAAPEVGSAPVGYGDDGDDDDLPEEPPHSADDPGAFSAHPAGEPGARGAAAGEGAATAGSQSFQGFVELLKKRRPALAATLAQVRPLVFGAGRVELGCETAFDENKLKDPDTRAYLEQLLAEHLGARTSCHVTRAGGSGPGPAPGGPATLYEVEDQQRQAKRSEKSTAARARPALRLVAEELGATVARVRVLDEE